MRSHLMTHQDTRIPASPLNVLAGRRGHLWHDKKIQETLDTSSLNKTPSGIPSSLSLAFTLSSVDGWTEVFMLSSFVSLSGCVVDREGLKTTNSIRMRLYTKLIVHENRPLFLTSSAFFCQSFQSFLEIRKG